MAAIGSTALAAFEYYRVRWLTEPGGAWRKSPNSVKRKLIAEKNREKRIKNKLFRVLEAALCRHEFTGFEAPDSWSTTFGPCDIARNDLTR